MDIDTYRKQRRGGHGITGMTTKEEDFVESVFVAEMKDYLLCFTNLGRVYWLKVYQIPESSRIAKGKPLVNLLNLKDEVVTTVLPIREFRQDQFLLFATKFGQAIKIRLDEFSNPRSTGTNAIRLKENDRLVDVILTNGNNELILTTRFGQSLRFHEETVRTVGRNAQGVRGMKLRGRIRSSRSRSSPKTTCSLSPMSASGNGASSTSSAGMAGARWVSGTCSSNAMQWSSNHVPFPIPMRSLR